jgi:putative transposase
VVVDTLGYLLRVWVHAADLADYTAAVWWLALVCAACPTLRLLFADGAYAGPLVDNCQRLLGLTVQIVRKLAGQRGFVPLPKRWIVERTLAWLGRNRRLSRDYEHLTECSETWVYLASIRLLVQRLAPP